jgi:hypothetical protein
VESIGKEKVKVKSRGISERQFIAVVVFSLYIYTVHCRSSQPGQREGRWAVRENGKWGGRKGDGKCSRKVCKR